MRWEARGCCCWCCCRMLLLLLLLKEEEEEADAAAATGAGFVGALAEGGGHGFELALWLPLCPINMRIWVYLAERRF